MKTKRILLLLILGLMLLTLCSCGGLQYQKYAKYAELFELLESNNYQGAIQMIIGMAQDQNQNGNQDNNNDGENDPPMFSPVGQYLAYSTEKLPVAFITYGEDGTLTIDGTAVACQTENMYSSYCTLTVTGNDAVSKIHFSRDNGLLSGSLYDASGDHLCNLVALDQLPEEAPANALQAATDWHAYRISDTTHYELTLNEDFTATVYGESYRWTVSSYYRGKEDYDSVTLRFYNDSGYAYSATAYARHTSGCFTMSVSNRKGEDNLTYYADPLVMYLTMTSLQPFDRWDHSSFYLGSDGSVSLSDMEYWKTVSSENGVLTGQVFADEADEPSYSFTIRMKGDYPQLVLTNLSDKSESVYYNGQFKYAKDDPEYVYQEMIHHIDSCLDGYSHRPDGYENYLRGSEYLGYIYAQLSTVSDYKDTTTYLNRFTIYRNKLQSAALSYADAFGNVTNSNLFDYTYNEKGLLSRMDINAIGNTTRFVLPIPMLHVGVHFSSYEDWAPVYDENGRVTAYHYLSGDTVRMKAMLTYDENGRVMSVEVINAQNDRYSAQMSYDANGRLVKIESADLDFSTGSVHTFSYAYNTDGTVASFTYLRDSENEFWSDTEYRVEYTYQNGKAVSARYRESSITPRYPENNSVVVEIEYTYSYNDNGDLAGAALRYITDTDYHDHALTYTYSDIYFYNAEA